MSAVSTASAETAPTRAHALDVESLKATGVNLADMASTLRDVRFRGQKQTSAPGGRDLDHSVPAYAARTAPPQAPRVYIFSVATSVGFCPVPAAGA